MPPARKTPAPQTNDALLGAILELVPSLFFKLKAHTEALHAREGLTTGERGVLRDLVDAGPMTVPALAARRPVSRQAIQQVTDRLLRRELIVAEHNPRHARSVLYAATARGRRVLSEAQRREGAALADVAGELPARPLRDTLAMLRRIDALLAADRQARR